MTELYDTNPGEPRVPLRATPEGYLIVQIAGGGGGGGSSVTDLTTTVSPTNVVVASDTGTAATIPLADVTNAGAMPPAAVTQLADLGTASKADVEDFAPAGHTHALLMTTDERTKLGALPAAADLGTSLAGKMANTLPAMQAVFDAGTAPEKAAFQSSVSGADYTATTIGGFTPAQMVMAKLPRVFTATANQNVAVTYGALSLRLSSSGGISLEFAFDHAGIALALSKTTASVNSSAYRHNFAYATNVFQKAHLELDIADAGAMQEVTLIDNTANKIYVCVMLVGAGAVNNFFSIEQIK